MPAFFPNCLPALYHAMPAAIYLAAAYITLYTANLPYAFLYALTLPSIPMPIYSCLCLPANLLICIYIYHIPL